MITQPQAKRHVGHKHGHKHPTAVFVLSFFLLNTLLFLPFSLLDPESTLLPSLPKLFAMGAGLGFNRLLLWRENLDPLRLSLEFTLLLALWLTLRQSQHSWLRRIVRWLIYLCFFLTLFYSIYEAILLVIYHSKPIFYSQYYLARDGLPFLAAHVGASPWLFVAAGLALLAAVAGIGWLIDLLLQSAVSPVLHPFVHRGFTVLSFFCLFAGLRYQGYTAKPQMVMSSLFFKFQQNMSDSIQLYYDVASFDDQAVQRAYAYTDYRLAKRPNIYLIFVESYGSSLYKRPEFRTWYLNLLSQLQRQLDQNGWQVASALSESPTWGGGSWMAYTSTLFGLHIDNHPYYLSLVNKYQLENYPDIGQWLKSQGYFYAWVSSISGEIDDETWNGYIRFLDVDRWLRYRDLDYRGPMYGWGPAPPDQFTLHYANQVLRRATDKPRFFVTITQNSHYPWIPQPKLVEDWQTLNHEEDASFTPIEEPSEAVTKQENYRQAIDYQLRMLLDFILKNGSGDDLFILMGDHQPPQVARRSEGWDTPVHLISKDTALLDLLAEYGFAPGLRIQASKPALHHEGVYSMLVRVLLARYGENPSNLPPYLPVGVVQEGEKQTSSQ